MAWQTNYFPSDLAAAVRLPGAGFSPATFVLPRAIDAKLAVGPGRAGDRGDERRSRARRVGEAAGRRHDAAPRSGSTARRRATRSPSPRPARAGSPSPGWRATACAGRRACACTRAKGRRGGSVRSARAPSGEWLGLAIDGAGATTVAWEEGLKAKGKDPTARSHLGIAYRAAGGRFRSPVFVGPVSLEMTPEAVQVGPGGRAWVFYEAFGSGPPGPGYRRVYVTERKR